MQDWINEGLKIVNKILSLSVQVILDAAGGVNERPVIEFVMVSTVSLLFRNSYVQAMHIYNTYREQSGTSRCSSCTP
jgi:hypothetical protein